MTPAISRLLVAAVFLGLSLCLGACAKETRLTISYELHESLVEQITLLETFVSISDSSALAFAETDSVGEIAKGISYALVLVDEKKILSIRHDAARGFRFGRGFSLALTPPPPSAPAALELSFSAQATGATGVLATTKSPVLSCFAP
jgi:hypothetical protein